MQNLKETVKTEKDPLKHLRRVVRRAYLSPSSTELLWFLSTSEKMEDGERITKSSCEGWGMVVGSKHLPAEWAQLRGLTSWHSGFLFWKCTYYSTYCKGWVAWSLACRKWPKWQKLSCLLGAAYSSVGTHLPREWRASLEGSHTKCARVFILFKNFEMSTDYSLNETMFYKNVFWLRGKWFCVLFQFPVPERLSGATFDHVVSTGWFLRSKVWTSASDKW